MADSKYKQDQMLTINFKTRCLMLNMAFNAQVTKPREKMNFQHASDVIAAVILVTGISSRIQNVSDMPLQLRYR